MEHFDVSKGILFVFNKNGASEVMTETEYEQTNSAFRLIELRAELGFRTADSAEAAEAHFATWQYMKEALSNTYAKIALRLTDEEWDMFRDAYREKRKKLTRLIETGSTAFIESDR